MVSYSHSCVHLSVVNFLLLGQGFELGFAPLRSAALITETKH